MESSWNFYGENPRLEYGETMDNWHAGKSKVGKYRNLLKWNGTRNRLERWKNVSENCRLGN